VKKKGKKAPDAGLTLRMHWREFEGCPDFRMLTYFLAGVPKRHVQGALIAVWLWCLERRTTSLSPLFVDSISEGIRLADGLREFHRRLEIGEVISGGPLSEMRIRENGDFEFGHLERYVKHIPVERRGHGKHQRSVSAGKRFKVLERDRFKCRYCGAPASERQLHVDHVVPVAANGGDDMENLITACMDCNLGKSSRCL
jgi:hypothetical protein